MQTLAASDKLDLALRRLSPMIGAEISGVDLSQPLSDASFKAIHAVWLQHHVIVFPGQNLDEGQQIAGKHFYRPSNPATLAKFQSQYPNLKLFTIDEVFGGWNPATKKFFEDGAIFDQIYLK